MATQFLRPATDIELPASRDFFVYEEASLDVTIPLWRNGTVVTAVYPTGDSGSFVLLFHQVATGPLPLGSTAATVQAALEALTTVGIGQVAVTLTTTVVDTTTTDSYEILWTGTMAPTKQDIIRVKPPTGTPDFTVASGPLPFPDAGDADHYTLQARVAITDETPVLELTSAAGAIVRNPDGSLSLWLDAGDSQINAPLAWTKAVYDLLLVHTPATHAERMLTGTITVVPAVTRLA